MAPEETTVTTTTTEVEGEPIPDTGQALVEAGALAGGALVVAADAKNEAEAANSKADIAIDAAMSSQHSSVTPEEARRIAREEYDLARNAEMSVEAPVVETPAPEPVIEEVAPEVAPESVEKANKGSKKKKGRGKWASWYEGGSDDDD
jgi:hypothetical protein